MHKEQKKFMSLIYKGNVLEKGVGMNETSSVKQKKNVS